MNMPDYNKEDFDKFILDKVDTIRAKYFKQMVCESLSIFDKPSEVYIDIRNVQLSNDTINLLTIEVYRDIDNMLNIRSKNILRLYLEVLKMYSVYASIEKPWGISSKYRSTTIPNGARASEESQFIASEFSYLMKTIRNKYQYNKIVGECYNNITNKLEYLLDDGRYSSEKIDLDLSVFPDSFSLIFGKNEFRDRQINKIIDE